MNSKILKVALSLGFVFFCAAASFAQTERENGIALYRQNNYAAAVKTLKSAVKSTPNDAEGWYFLGLAYLGADDEKNSIKAFKKAVEIKPADSALRGSLAYAYLVKNNTDEASNEAKKALELNPKNAEAHYVLGVAAFRWASYNAAYERAEKTIELNPKIAPAYLLKSEALIASFLQQVGTVMKPANARSEMLSESAKNLEIFLQLTPGNKDANFYREYLESIKFFAEYYNRTEHKQPRDLELEAKPNDGAEQLKITYKPRASYTDEARRRGVSGSVRLLVGFSADGAIKHVLVLNPLGYGLNEEAVKAARSIKYDPATKDGKPISVVKQVVYSFTIY